MNILFFNYNSQSVFPSPSFVNILEEYAIVIQRTLPSGIASARKINLVPQKVDVRNEKKN